MNDEEFQKLLERIKEEAKFTFDGKVIDYYYIGAGLINMLDEEQKLELLLFSKKYPIKVSTTHPFATFSLHVFLAEMADKYKLLLQ